MITFKYYIELKKGYKPTMQTELENEVIITISAKNRVTADRAIKAMITPGNVTEVSGVAIHEED